MSTHRALLRLERKRAALLVRGSGARIAGQLTGLIAGRRPYGDPPLALLRPCGPEQQLAELRRGKQEFPRGAARTSAGALRLIFARRVPRARRRWRLFAKRALAAPALAASALSASARTRVLEIPRPPCPGHRGGRARPWLLEQLSIVVVQARRAETRRRRRSSPPAAAPSSRRAWPRVPPLRRAP